MEITTGAKGRSTRASSSETLADIPGREDSFEAFAFVVIATKPVFFRSRSGQSML
jgi:hypothetical protein